MVIAKHLIIAYVARSEETTWKTWHRQGQLTQIVFVFEDRIEFEVAAEWLSLSELRFAEYTLLAFVSDFCTFTEGIYWCL
jgi:hypothetical protein